MEGEREEGQGTPPACIPHWKFLLQEKSPCSTWSPGDHDKERRHQPDIKKTQLTKLWKDREGFQGLWSSGFGTGCPGSCRQIYTAEVTAPICFLSINIAGWECGSWQNTCLSRARPWVLSQASQRERFSFMIAEPDTVLKLCCKVKNVWAKGRVQVGHSLKPVQANSLWDYILKKPTSKKG
jgi:hypothetical protein